MAFMAQKAPCHQALRQTLHGSPWPTATHHSLPTTAPTVAPAWQTLLIDCANGVGAWKLKASAPLLAEAGLQLELRNTGEGVLNGGCGSDFLQKDRRLPQGFEAVLPGARCAPGDSELLSVGTRCSLWRGCRDVPQGRDAKLLQASCELCTPVRPTASCLQRAAAPGNPLNRRCCSIDGDCDRLMYFTPTEEGPALLFDGDKIATLAALLIRDLISKLPPSAAGAKVGLCPAGGGGRVAAVGTCSASAGWSPRQRRWKLQAASGCWQTTVPHVVCRATVCQPHPRPLLARRRWALCRRHMPTAAPPSSSARSWAVQWRSRPRVGGGRGLRGGAFSR